MHHVDIHAHNLSGPKRLFAALAPAIGYRTYYADDEFIGFEPENGGRPRFGILLDPQHTAGSMRVAFSRPDRAGVDAAARAAREGGARSMDGPAIHAEYGDDYYAVFFEDDQGNKYEIVADPGGAG